MLDINKSSSSLVMYRSVICRLQIIKRQLCNNNSLREICIIIKKNIYNDT